MKEYEVKVFYKACIKYKVSADNRSEAHKKAYTEFMDTSTEATLKRSNIDNLNNFFVESSIDGDEDGSDMIHE